MVLFNYSTRELTAKIVYYGPGLCGKTTNLQFIHQNLPGDVKGKMLSLATKTDRTLFFDFLPLDLGSIRGMKTRVQLYTVPGQVFYNETRKLVLKGADGIVFVADSQKQMLSANVESFRNLEENLKAHGLSLATMPHVIQFNKRDLPNLASIEELNAALNKYNAPFYESVATTGIGVQDTLRAIVKLVLLHLTRKYDPQAKRTQPASASKTETTPKPAAARAATPTPGPQSADHAQAQTPPASATSIPVSDFDPVATQRQPAAPEAAAAPAAGGGPSTPPPAPDFFGPPSDSDPVPSGASPREVLSAEPAGGAGEAPASDPSRSAPPPPPDFFGAAPDPEEEAVPEFGDEDIEELVEEVEELRREPVPDTPASETPMAAAPSPSEPGEVVPPADPRTEETPAGDPTVEWSLEGNANTAAEAPAGDPTAEWSPEDEADAAAEAPAAGASPAFEVDRTFDPEWASGGAHAPADLVEVPGGGAGGDLATAAGTAEASAEPREPWTPPPPEPAGAEVDPTGSAEGDSDGRAADAAVALEAPAPDAELFQDPALDVARLQPGEQRTVVVPVELGKGPERRRYKLSIALRLEPVE